MTRVAVPIPTRSALRALAALLLVWGVWILMQLVALVYVWHFARDVPFWDDWTIIPALVDPKEYLTVSWLWELIGEHRVPVPKLLSILLLRLGGYDFRTGMYFNVLALGALSGALIWGARRVRGWTEVTDVLFPLALLHLGLSDMFLRGWMVHFVVPSVLAGVVLLVIVCKQDYLTLPAALLTFVCEVVMIGCGPPGLAYAPGLSLWLAYEGGRHWFSGEAGGRLRGLVVLGLAGAGAALVWFYFQGYRGPGIYQHPTSEMLVDTAAQLLVLSFGPGAGVWYPYSAGAVAVLALLSTGIVVAGWRRAQPERSRAVGLFLFLGGVGSLLAGLTWGRASTGYFQITNPQDFSYFEYNLLPVAGLCGLYFGWTLYGPPALGVAMRVLLCGGLALTLLVNLEMGLRYGRDRAKHWDAFERDFKAGAPPSRLIARHANSALMPGCAHHESMGYCMGQMREAKIGRFKDLAPDPVTEEADLVLIPREVQEAHWDESGRTVSTDTGDGFVEFEVPRGWHVVAVRIHHLPPANLGKLILSWKRPDQTHFTNDYPQAYELNSYVPSAEPGKPASFLVYIEEEIDALRIYPDTLRPSAFTIQSIQVLVATKYP